MMQECYIELKDFLGAEAASVAAAAYGSYSDSADDNASGMDSNDGSESANGDDDSDYKTEDGEDDMGDDENGDYEAEDES